MVCYVARSNIWRSIILNKSRWEMWHVQCCSRMNIKLTRPYVTVVDIINYRYRRKVQERHHYNYCCNMSSKVLEPFFPKNEYMHKLLTYRTISGNGNESDSDSVGMEDFFEPTFIPGGKESVHDLLSPNSEDPVILRLMSTSSVEEVFDVIKDNESHIKSIHLVHTVLALWDLQLSSIILGENASVTSPCPLIPETFIAELLSSNYMKQFIGLLEDNCENMSPDEMAFTTLYLGKMGFSDVESKGQNIPLINDVVFKLYKSCESKLHTFSLPALSRWMAGTRYWRHTKPAVFDMSSFRDNVEEIVFQRMDECSNIEDFRLMTICLAHLRPCIDLDSLHKYKKWITGLVSKECFNITELRSILRAAAFLNMPHWSHLNTDLLRTLLLFFKGKIKELKPSDIILVNHLLQSQLEPAILITEVQEAASELLKEKNHEISIIDLMSCLVLSLQPSNKKNFEDTLLEFICSSLSPRLLPATFIVLRNLKTSNVNLCDEFWSRVLEYIKAKPALQNDLRLLRYCHWYMHFNNNLAGTYHHHSFEACMSEMLLMSKWENPSAMARASSFIIAYSRRIHDVEAVLDISKKLIELVPELNADDCCIISLGLRISMGTKSVQRRNKNITWLWSQLARRLDYRSEEQLKRPDISLREMNMLMKGFIERRAFNDKGSVIQDHIAKYYDNVNRVHQTSGGTLSKDVVGLSSRTVRDNCFIMVGCGWLFPGAVEWMSGYVIQHGLHLVGETVERVVQSLFHLNHWPKDAPLFFETISQILDRDKERISGLSLIQVALGLCFFNSLPNSLIHYIFAVDFLEKIDDEIRFCYAKAIYPLRLRHKLMELNRAVCLGYPEADVPWFHTNYCKGIISAEPTTRSHVHKAIYSTLMELMGGRDGLIQEMAYTPYFHKIDFLLVLDENKKPLKPQLITQKDVLERRLTRIAVLIRRAESYCRSSNTPRPCLKGLSRLHERHLQLLGYEVVGIPVHFWDSLQMASNEARVRHMRERIFGKDLADSSTIT